MNNSATMPMVPKMSTTPAIDSSAVQVLPAASRSPTSRKPVVVRVMTVMYRPSPRDQPAISTYPTPPMTVITPKTSIHSAPIWSNER